MIYKFVHLVTFSLHELISYIGCFCISFLETGVVQPTYFLGVLFRNMTDTTAINYGSLISKSSKAVTLAHKGLTNYNIANG
jgi:hypothetical protein